jgi:hypothetical protein
MNIDVYEYEIIEIDRLNYFRFQRNLEPETLGLIFANAYFGNSVVAILSGIFAQFVAYNFGYV